MTNRMEIHIYRGTKIEGMQNYVPLVVGHVKDYKSSLLLHEHKLSICRSVY